MSEAEQESLAKEQARALDVYKPAGALLTNEYLERHQEIVGVNRNDLEDIRGFDILSNIFFGAGMFFLSGATWLLVDRLTQMPKFELTTAVGISGVSILAGLFALVGGLALGRMKRGRIQRIFDQTKRVG